MILAGAVVLALRGGAFGKADAGRQKADLVVLPEVLTSAYSSRSEADCAEPVPGPSTAYFGELPATGAR